MNLTRDEARERARTVAVDSYDVRLDLTTGDKTFRSETVVRFRALGTGLTTFLDLIAAAVHEATLNGVALDPADVFDGTRVRLDALSDENELRVVADCLYMHTGEGLHRFVDPVDKEVYLYTQFEVADSRRMFGVFEQPDLKATFAFTVDTPDHWTVVSNAPTPEPESLRDGVARWTFPPTQRISSYITALVAGPYHGEHGEYRRGDRVIPLGVFCRKSLGEHLDTDAILEVTRQGFDYFHEAFGIDYPFEKYDQLFVPEFNAGAMENAGAVTFLEDYVFRSKVPDVSYERRAETILHEMAHMWFGDLVTMQWWDDLWLNESFATWASVVAQAEGTRWTQAWTTFANAEKAWAYRQDQLPSTHPIAADIRDLEDVEVNFDGITYAKGASVLKQLVAYVGRDEFLDGVRRYMTAHAWGNTTLADLFSELEATSGRDLKTWSERWLEKAGINTLRPDFAVDADGTFTSFSVLQEAPDEWPTLRPHRLAIGLYEGVDGRLVRKHRVELDIDGARTEVPALVGMTRPDLVLLNDDDLTYGKIRLDEASMAAALASLNAFDTSLPRTLIWSAAWDMTRDAQMRARDFIDLVVGGIVHETDSSVVGTLLRQVRLALEVYVAADHRGEAAGRLADGILAHVRASAPGSDKQLQFVRAFAGVASSAEHLSLLQSLLDGTQTLDGLVVDTDLRWSLLSRLVSRGSVPPSAIDDELARDATATGARHAEALRASVPSEQAKSDVWAKVVDADELPNALQTAAIGGFMQDGQEELLRPYVAPYFAAIGQVWATRTNETAQNVVVGMFPSLLASDATLAEVDAWLAKVTDAPPALRRLVVESRDGMARALRAQAYDAAR